MTYNEKTYNNDMEYLKSEGICIEDARQFILSLLYSGHDMSASDLKEIERYAIYNGNEEDEREDRETDNADDKRRGY